ncbi:MAG: exonuclease SbcCD subunit D C-terminal domain-containing protein [Bacteroidales bacterium]|jgi:exonuclease SbcD|nr:exonuclease SbcCD subunit D C-terminal domain-containing protein [Bacteroidales bacterium]
MKILHTADWHIGHSFYEYDRQKEHLYFFDWLKQQIGQWAIDVLLIAGDVFDSQNPSADSQKMFYRFLKEATTAYPTLQIVVIAGNHDSAGRLEAPNPLLEEMNITVRGLVTRNTAGVIDFDRFVVPLMQGDAVKAWCLAVPYLRQGDYPEHFDAAQSPHGDYAQGIANFYAAVYERIPDKSKPVIAMGHLHATGAALSVNDRFERVILGGLESISTDIFAKGIAYTALGHLHRAQNVGGSEKICYAGAPLPMSFAEKNNKQGVTLITTGESSSDVQIERILFDTPVKLLNIPREPQPLQEVLAAIQELPDGEIAVQSPFLEINVLLNEPEPALRHRIEDALSGKSVRLARIVAEYPQNTGTSTALNYEKFQSLQPVNLAMDVYQRQYSEEMPEALKKLLTHLISNLEQ